jgi:hypothetical protein
VEYQLAQNMVYVDEIVTLAQAVRSFDDAIKAGANYALLYGQWIHKDGLGEVRVNLGLHTEG